MNQMIDIELVKKLRKQQSWSQEQLASESGLSLRTIQRIENEGRCSLASKNALATTFGIDSDSLDVDHVAMKAQAANERGRKLGFRGITVGLICAYIGITFSLITGNMSLGESGAYYGGIAALCGICYAIIGMLSHKYQT